MFDIRIMPGRRDRSQKTVLAEIAIGKFRESFLMDVTYWSVSAYRRQWLGACRRFLEGERPVLLLTSTVGPPRKAKYFGCWVLYHDQRRVKIQNLIAVPGSRSCATWRGVEKLLEPTPQQYSDAIDKSTGKRIKISQWQTTILSIEGFSDRLRAGSRSGMPSGSNMRRAKK